MKPALMPNGYVTYAPCINAKNKQTYAHRIVAIAFLGPVPEGKEVNHIDGNKQNNRADNLEYVTRKENMAHALATGLWEQRKPRLGPKKPPKPKQEGERHWMRHKPERIARGERQGSSKLTSAQVEEIRARVAAGEMQCKIAKEFGMGKPQICRIVNRKQWKIT